jgi:hypothetical protein
MEKAVAVAESCGRVEGVGAMIGAANHLANANDRDRLTTITFLPNRDRPFHPPWFVPVSTIGSSTTAWERPK